MRSVLVVLLKALLADLVTVDAQYNLSTGPADWTASNVRVVIQFNGPAQVAEYGADAASFDSTLHADIFSVISQQQYAYNVSDVLLTSVGADNSTAVLYTYHNLQCDTVAQSVEVYNTLYSEYGNESSFLHTHTTVLQYASAMASYCKDSSNNTVPCTTVVLQLQYAEPSVWNSIYSAIILTFVVYSYMYLAVYRPNRPRVTQAEYDQLWPRTAETDSNIKIAQIMPVPTSVVRAMDSVQPIHIPAPYMETAEYIDVVDGTPRSSMVKPPVAESTPKKFHVDHNGRVSGQFSHNMMAAQALTPTSNTNTKMYSHTPTAPHTAHPSISIPVVPRHRVDNSIRLQPDEVVVPPKLYTAARRSSVIKNVFNTGIR